MTYHNRNNDISYLAAFSIVYFFIDSSLVSNLVALSLVCAAVAVVRQFRDKRNRSD